MNFTTASFAYPLPSTASILKKSSDCATTSLLKISSTFSACARACGKSPVVKLPVRPEPGLENFKSTRLRLRLRTNCKGFWMLRHRREASPA
jgi:hypothetical protein